MEKKLLVKSLRVEKKLTYNNRDDEYEDNDIYILNCIDKTNKKYELRIWTEYGDCYSGWCSASWGHGEIREVENFIGMTHKAKRSDLEIVVEHGEDGTLADQGNEIFELEEDDDYYPNGYGTISSELFEETNRNKKKRPVWIFVGDSCLGKSYLAGIIANFGYMKEVYETDAHEQLGGIHEDIIVVGNKYSHSVDDVEKFIIGEHETIVVNFEKY